MGSSEKGIPEMSTDPPCPSCLRELVQGPPGLPDAVIKFCARRRIGSWCFPPPFFFLSFFTSLLLFFFSKAELKLIR